MDYLISNNNNNTTTIKSPLLTYNPVILAALSHSNKPYFNDEIEKSIESLENFGMRRRRLSLVEALNNSLEFEDHFDSFIINNQVLFLRIFKVLKKNLFLLKLNYFSEIRKRNLKR